MSGATHFGIDLGQWRALVAAYLRIDLRAGAGPSAPDRRGAGGLALARLLVMTLLGGGLLALLGARLPDVLLGATLVTTVAVVNTVILLFVEFNAVVLSPDDHHIIGPRPVTSRTYFAARLTAVLVYVSVIGLAVASPPAVAYAWWRGLGALAGAGMLAAVLLCNAAATVIVIATYVLLLDVVHPPRLRRAVSWLHLAGAASFYAVLYASVRALEDADLRWSSPEALPVHLVPTAWFAALVPIGAGIASEREWWAAGAAALVAAACVPLAAGRLSLDYSRQIGELTAAAGPVRSSRPALLPGFRRGEGRAIALLVRAQFRFDQRFRLTVLGTLPLLLFYVLLGLGEGALVDPFSGNKSAAAPLYMAVVFLPMVLHSSLRSSESWRAAWIFFAAPASPARLVVATKNFAAVYVLGGFVLLLAAVWSVFYDRVWHAAVHASVVALLAHVLLQLAVMIHPALPFASEPRRAEMSGALFGLFLLAGVAATLAISLTPYIYARPAALVAFAGSLAGLTVALELLLRRRVERAMAEVEFR